MEYIKTLRVRIKDRHAKALLELAGAVNTVWNFDNELSFKHTQRTGKFFSAFDLNPYTKGAGKELGLHSQTIQAINEEFVCRRKQFKLAKLRWRVSRGARRSLGWIPFKGVGIRYKAGQLHYGELSLGLWDSYGLSNYDLGPGSFSEDARGRWYANITVKIPELCGPKLPAPKASVGIDLGLRELAAFSDPVLDSIEAKRFHRDLEPALAKAQRAGKKDRVKCIHAKIANRRKDQLHKLSTRLVKNYGVIVVGNVDSSKLVKTKMAKSVLDAGWSTFKTQLSYKSHWAASVFRQVNESFSSQDCSACGSRSGPKGLEGLKVVRWTCSCCGIEHDRNRNAAVNIVIKGLLEIEKEKPVAGETKVYEAVMNKDSGEVFSMAGPGNRPLVAGISVI
jgi:IS605 OrfB family transposase